MRDDARERVLVEVVSDLEHVPGAKQHGHWLAAFRLVLHVHRHELRLVGLRREPHILFQPAQPLRGESSLFREALDREAAPTPGLHHATRLDLGPLLVRQALTMGSASLA